MAHATLSPAFREPSLVPCGFPSCQFRVSELPLDQVSCFCGFSHGLDPVACNIAPPSRQPNSRSSVRYLAVDLCFGFHRLLDEGTEEELRLLEDKESEESELLLLLSESESEESDSEEDAKDDKVGRGGSFAQLLVSGVYFQVLLQFVHP